MAEIHVNTVSLVDKQTVRCELSSSRPTVQFLTGDDFYAKYDEDISGIPKSILSIPLLSNILPVAWVSGSDIYIEQLDAAFYNSLPAIKAALADLYPDAPFDQESSIYYETLVDNTAATETTSEKASMLFTGGVDSTATFIRHIDEQPTFFSVFDETPPERWSSTRSMIADVAADTGVTHHVIESNIQEILNYHMLDLYYFHLLNRTWFEAIQFGIGYTGLTAPLTYRDDIDRVYQASGYTTNQNYPMAAQPPIVNNLSWSGTTAEIDAVEHSRQDKIEIIAEFVATHETALEIHTCNLSKSKPNCSRCEKCLRTIAGLVVAGVDPSEYGFEIDETTFELIREQIQENLDPSAVSTRFWLEIQARAPESVELSIDGVSEFLKWLDSYEIEKSELEMPDKEMKLRRQLLMSLPYPFGNWAMNMYQTAKSEFKN